MENVINYYYNLYPLDIKKIDDDFHFIADNNYYILSLIFDDINDIKQIINELNKTNFLYHLLVLNKDNEFTVNYNSNNYALFKVRVDQNYQMQYDELPLVNIKSTNDWALIWSSRIDYYESQFFELDCNKDIINSMQYYIGLSEIAISYYNTIKDNYSNEVYSISHKKNSSPVNILKFLNPANMIIDLSIRDFSEYIKESFFNDILTNNDILNLIKKYNFNDTMANYFLDRLLYPSYFFNIYDNYIENKEISEELFEIIKKAQEYELLLNEIYFELISKYRIIFNCWIFKSQH